MATKIQLRRDTAADWTSGNPTLAAGEFAWESDTNRYKIGDGATAWNSLGYADTLSTLGDLSVTGSTISSPSNADLTLTTSGTGDIVLDALRINGTTLDSSDSSKITIAEALDVTGAVTITSGTITGITDLTVADGGTGASSLTSNAVLTGTGTSPITAEGNLSFDGSTLAVTGNITATTSIANDAIKIDDHTISGLRSNDNIIIDPAGTGDILLGNFRFDVDQSVASGQDNYVLTYDDSSGKISLEASAGGGGGVSLSGSTNNTIATVTGSNALIGEANATFDGSTLAITGAITATTNISTDAIQLVDNKIQASRSNDNLYIQPAGSGVTVTGNADWYDDFGGLISGAYGSVDRFKGNAMYYVDEAIVPGADRTYVNWIQTSLKTDGSDTTSSDARFRNICVTALDLNGSSITHSNLSRGVQALALTAYITSSNTDDSIISSATGFRGYGYISPKVNGNLTVTNMLGVNSSCEVAVWNLGAGKTALVTNAYGYHFAGNGTSGTGSGGTATITNSYGFYADMNSDDGATSWAFYDNSASGQSKFGDVKIEGNTISTLSSNANLEIGTSGTGTIELQADTNVTGDLTTSAISLVDNKISANRSNDSISIQGNGTGQVLLAANGGDLSNFSTSARYDNANVMLYQDLDHTLVTSSSDRPYKNIIIQDIKLTASQSSSDSDQRWRNRAILSLELNGSSSTATSSQYRSRGPIGLEAYSNVSNNSATNATLGQASGGNYGVAVYPGSSGDLTITNLTGMGTFFEMGTNTGDLTITDIVAYESIGMDYSHGSGTSAVTDFYHFRAGTHSITNLTLTNNYAFYSEDATASSRMGAIRLDNQAGDPTHGADFSWIYAKDDSASSEVYVKDEAGNATKISPHNKQGEWEYYSKNTRTGKTVRVNMEALVKEVENLSGKKFIETI